MAIDILIDGKNTEFSDADFPMLISGAEKRGVSFFSICLMAKLVASGRRILFFSAYPSAKEELRKQLPSEAGALIIDSGEERAFLKAISKTEDLAERFVLVKNFDLFSPALFSAVQGLKRVIFAGDLDNCRFSDRLLQAGLATKIFFSQSKKDPQVGMVDCPRYEGKIFSSRKRGIVKLGDLISE